MTHRPLIVEEEEEKEEEEKEEEEEEEEGEEEEEEEEEEDDTGKGSDAGARRRRGPGTCAVDPQKTPDRGSCTSHSTHGMSAKPSAITSNLISSIIQPPLAPLPSCARGCCGALATRHRENQQARGRRCSPVQ